MYITRQPAFQALCKVTDGLGEGARNGPQHVGDEKVHDALVEDVVTSVEVVNNWLAACQENDLLLWQLVV